MPKENKFPYICFLTGASGAGKSSLVASLSKELSHGSIELLHFDSIGVSSEAEMIAQ